MSEEKVGRMEKSAKGHGIRMGWVKKHNRKSSVWGLVKKAIEATDV